MTRPSNNKSDATTPATSSYFTASKRGVWCIGSDVILEDRPDKGPKTQVEVKPLKDLANCPEIPVPRGLHDGFDRDGRYFGTSG
ncbi:hypothetical protein N7520_010143 [Penicillium odoratum]|uniref:uncharacterized protein n=1 Tax=Penicillium odoratum TaxID=1167516 RepID=UPI002547707E|nr:uncharacterized protein N7520_010143 [Penicillium odoratum]KAJ5753226.1 hypothetical protein N7520_010143 [Penicillium odoratum]